MYLTLCVGKHMSANTYINDGICYGVHDRFAFLTRRKACYRIVIPSAKLNLPALRGG